MANLDPTSELAHQAHATILERAKAFRPTDGMILGSGLGALADAIDRPLVFPFAELPGFPVPSVEGHAGRLVLGHLEGRPVACLQGRVHLYEGHPPATVRVLVRTLQLLGCERLLLTNAAGSLDPSMPAGSLMLITDHINMQGVHPLAGVNDPAFGPRFPAMTGAYDPTLMQSLRQSAQQLQIDLHEGVYMAVLGPTFETPAEIRAFARLGAQAVGMSTVPEVIVARHCGLRCAAVSVITNLGAGLDDETLSHDQTLAFAQRAGAELQQVVRAYLKSL